MSEGEEPIPAEDWVIAINPEKSPHWKTEGLAFNLGASQWAAEIARDMLRHIKKAIPAGKAPAGGSTPPLAPESYRAKKAAKGKRPKARAFTEHRIWVRSLRTMAVKKGRRHAIYAVTTELPDVFYEWLVREKARGVDYFPVHGDMNTVVQRALDNLVKKAVRRADRKAKKLAETQAK